jgi:hypothetical protein
VAHDILARCLYRPQNSVEQLKGFLLADVRTRVPGRGQGATKDATLARRIPDHPLTGGQARTVAPAALSGRRHQGLPHQNRNTRIGKSKSATARAVSSGSRPIQRQHVEDDADGQNKLRRGPGSTKAFGLAAVRRFAQRRPQYPTIRLCIADDRSRRNDYGARSWSSWSVRRRPLPSRSATFSGRRRWSKLSEWLASKQSAGVDKREGQRHGMVRQRTRRPSSQSWAFSPSHGTGDRYRL